jgi:hypothetical protein
MRQNLRPKVLLPVAVLALVGVAYGAFAYGSPPDAPEPVVVPHHAKPKPTDPGAVPLAKWVKDANALCAKVKAEELPELKTADLDQLQALAAKALTLSQSSDAEFVGLGWPEGEKATILRFRAINAKGTESIRKLLAAFNASDGRKASRLASEIEDPGDRAFWNAQMKRLGATKCISKASAREKPKKLREPDTSVAQLKIALYRKRVAVVVFYSPRTASDAVTAVEGRAAALNMNASFVGVNVGNNKQLSSLAAKYSVSQAPAVLVFVRGPKLVWRFDGFADRDTIKQAIHNNT